MKIEEVIRYLDGVVPTFLQESYDNSGFMIGDSNAELKGIITCVDVTEDVLEEAKRKSCNLVLSHHPLIFQGMKKLTGQDHVAKTVQKAVKENIAVYAAHTNLDSVDFGVSAILSGKIGLKGTKVLEPRTGVLKKLAVFCPED